ncbi:MAG: hypothetical protein HXY30_03375 [Pseudorhodoplanes sp.]|nr:hypothetical protein [Pseudorhodoplanes sp.]
MRITVNSRIIAEVMMQPVVLVPAVGACEIMFPLRVRVPRSETEQYEATIYGAQVKICPSTGGEHKLGFARFEVPLRLQPKNDEITESSTLSLMLLPNQVNVIEDIRAAGDLTFELVISGECKEEKYRHRIYDTWRVSATTRIKLIIPQARVANRTTRGPKQS